LTESSATTTTSSVGLEVSLEVSLDILRDVGRPLLNVLSWELA